jgi:xanthine dehydrogenase accessory factor
VSAVLHWMMLAEAARRNLRACRVAVVDGPAPLIGTCLVLGPFGELMVAGGRDLGAEGSTLAALARGVLADGRPRVETIGSLRVYAEPLLPPPHLVIAGAGHVAVALAPAAQAAGFRVTVIDDRPDFAVAERFPGATVVCADMAEALGGGAAPGGICLDGGTFVVLAGRSHLLDKEALRAALRLPAAYVGMMGSRRKARELKAQLLAEGSVTQKACDRLRAPIGLDLGAETPAEIAVSIVAELIAARRGGSGVPLSDQAATASAGSGGDMPPAAGGLPAGTLEGARVWGALGNALTEARACALATIVQARGSTPRSAGAAMLVLGDSGAAVGSIGGGRWESEVHRAALKSLQTGTPVCLSPRYNDQADMICGGSAEVFIEPVMAGRR